MSRLPDDTYTISDAARLLDISENAVRQRIKRGTIEATKIDGVWRVTLPETATDQEATSRADYQSDQEDDHQADYEGDQETTNLPAGLLALSYTALSPLVEKIEEQAERIGRLSEQVDQLTTEKSQLEAELETLRQDAPRSPETGLGAPGEAQARQTSADASGQASRLRSWWEWIKRH
jgi:chromosome segregation ATPase